MDASLGVTMERQSTVDGLRRRPISRLEYERMAEVGILAPDERIELLRGEIVAMSPIGSRHAWSVAKVTRLLVEQLGPSYDIRPQSPLTLWDDSEPEPDLAVVPAGTPDRHPDTCLLVIEVAQTSLRVDATIKAALYAEAAIPVYWIVDVARGLVLVHTEPTAGRYQRIAEHRPGDVLTAPHLPTLAIPVAAIVAT
jgi:Uma2 family endonuclease